MVYCDGVEVDSKLGRLIQAFRCDRPSEWQMDGFIQMAEDMHKEITRLREAEMDAARYKYLKSDHKTKNLYSYQQDIKDRYWDEDIDSEINQAMKEIGDE